MTAHNYAPYLRRLNDTCAQALADAASLCEARAHRNIEVEHWLLKLLEQDNGDLAWVLRRYQIDVNDVWNGLLAAIERFPRDLRGRPGLSPRLTALLEKAWLQASMDVQHKTSLIRSMHLLAALAEHPQLLNAPGAWPLLTISATQIERLMSQLDTEPGEVVIKKDVSGSARGLTGGVERDHAQSGASISQDREEKKGAALSRYTTDVTQKAREGRIDPVFGRDAEIRQIIDILLRRRKNNPILVGDPGVGKTAVVEGLALKIAEGDVPSALRGVSVLTLDLGLLQAGAGVKGEFEQRLRCVIDETQQSSVPILLFMDEAHTLIGAGNVAGGTDAANLLKPALARGELRMIAATTWSEYKQYFERDAALERRFQLVRLDEPDDDNACLMLRGLKDRYAAHHGVHITDTAVTAAVRLSRRYLTGRQLPDKAVDLLDTAAARVRMSMDAKPQELTSLEIERCSLEVERKALQQDQGLMAMDAKTRLDEIGQRIGALTTESDRLKILCAEQRFMVEQLQSLRDQWRSCPEGSDARSVLESSITQLHGTLAQQPTTQQLVRAQVDEAVVAHVVADWTGVPIGNLLADEFASLLDLETGLGETVLGQEAALAAISKRLRTAKAGLASDQQPLGVFLLAGPSGVGKTETAKALANVMFGGEDSLITINLSEYQEAHTVSQLKGSPPGYVGYGQGGILTEAVRKRPYSVVLLDEVEKAHRDVLNLFYQVFDRGFMRDGEGRWIDFRNTVILMTSNLGSEQIMEVAEAASASGAEITETLLMQVTRPLLLDYFKPALLARFQTVIYRPLSEQALASIVRMKLDKVAERVRQNFGASLSCEGGLVEELAQSCQLADSGARGIDHVMDQQILPVLSRELMAYVADKRFPDVVSLKYSGDLGLTVDFEFAAERER